MHCSLQYAPKCQVMYKQDILWISEKSVSYTSKTLNWKIGMPGNRCKHRHTVPPTLHLVPLLDLHLCSIFLVFRLLKVLWHYMWHSPSHTNIHTLLATIQGATCYSVLPILQLVEDHSLSYVHWNYLRIEIILYHVSFSMRPCFSACTACSSTPCCKRPLLSLVLGYFFSKI